MLGLLAGLTLPGLALTLRPWLPQMVAALLFISAVRIGPRATLGTLRDAGKTGALIVAYQVALPLGALALAHAAGIAGYPLALAAVLMLAAPSITGSPNFTALMGHDPAPPMRLLILGTAVFPLTVLPVLWFAPVIGGMGAVLGAALKLFVVIAAAVGAGFMARRFFLPDPGDAARRALDGASAILLGVLVVGLMSALGPALRSDPGEVFRWLTVAAALNFGLQILAYPLVRQAGFALIAGNRNIALFLVALPPEVTDPILIFIGCYQIPMYLTPIVMGRLYGKASSPPV